MEKENLQPSAASRGPHIYPINQSDARDTAAEEPALSGPTIVRQVNDAVAADLQANAASDAFVPKGSVPSESDSHVPLSRCSLPELNTATFGRHHRRLSSLSIRSPMSTLGSLRHVDILSEEMPQPTLEVERGQLAQQVVDVIKDDTEPLAIGTNFRDVATTSPETIRSGLAFRSSQVFSENEIKDMKIHSALDLRAEPHECRKARKHNVATGIAVAPLELLPDRLKLQVHRALPLPCTRCSNKLQSSCGSRTNLYKCSLNVYHVDMLPAKVKLRIFRDMPWSIRLRTIVAPFCHKSPQEVMTPAVADPNVLGYLKLYIMMLDMAMQEIARALRVFRSEENLPCVVHCIHGKDRTGLIMALLLLTLGVPEELVVLDYAKSEVELKSRREKGALAGELDDYLVRDDIIASSAQTMEDTLRYLNSRYRGIRNYLRIIGITRHEVHDIRATLLQPHSAHERADALSALSAFSMGSSDSGDLLSRQSTWFREPMKTGRRVFGLRRHSNEKSR